MKKFIVHKNDTNYEAFLYMHVIRNFFYYFFNDKNSMRSDLIHLSLLI